MKTTEAMRAEVLARDVAKDLEADDSAAVVVSLPMDGKQQLTVLYVDPVLLLDESLEHAAMQVGTRIVHAVRKRRSEP